MPSEFFFVSSPKVLPQPLDAETLTLADQGIVENRISKIEKKAETTKDKQAVLELGALRKINRKIWINRYSSTSNSRYEIKNTIWFTERKNRRGI